MKMRIGLILAILVCGMSCKQNPIAKNFQASAAPSGPVVHSVGFSQSATDGAGNVTTVTVAPAWAFFNLNMTNNNTSEITITDIEFSGTATDNTGATIQISSSFGVANLVPPLVPDPTTGLTRTYLADLKPAPGTSADPNTATLPIYIQSLPCNVRSYNFSLTATIIGWVGSPTQPTQDFQKIISIETTGTPLTSGTCPTQ